MTDWRIALADVRLSAAQRRAAMEVLDSGWLSMGPRTASFEGAYAAAAGVEHAVFVSSATAALILALKAFGVGPGDEVIVPSLTFVADANAVTVLGARPVFADVVSAGRPVLDVSDVESLYTDRTRAVIAVHYGGYRATVDGLSRWKERGVRILEDASHAVGPVNDDGHWMSFNSDAAVFSFFANKNLATGEGGMLTTEDAALAERVRLLRSHGMTTGTWERHRGHASEYDVVEAGWNFRPHEVTAALGLNGLGALDEHNTQRRLLLRQYHRRIGEIDGLAMTFDPAEPTTGHLAAALVPAGTRPRVRDALTANRIQSSFHYPPIHRFTAYALSTMRPLPRTDEAAERLITLPLHPWMTESDVDLVVDVMCDAITHR